MIHFKKNKFTNIIWFLFILLTFGMLLIASRGIADKLGKKDDVLFIGMSYFIILISAEVIYGLSILLRKIGLFDYSDNPILMMQKEKIGIFDFLYLIIAGFLMLLVRFFYLLNYNISEVNDSLFYNYAINGLNNSSLSVLGKLYVNIISFVLNIFGSDIKYPIYFNVFLQLLIFVFIYFILKLLINRFSAVFASLVFAFLVYDINEIVNISPELLLTTITFLLLFLYLIFENILSKKNVNKVVHSILRFILGFSTGLFLYYELSGLACFFTGLIFLFFYSKHYLIKNNIISQLFIFLLGTISGFVSLLLYYSFNSNIAISNLLLTNYSFFNDIKINFFLNSPAYGTFFSALLMGLSFIWLFRIFAIERDFASAIIFFTIVISLYSLISIDINGYSFLITSLYCCLASFGLASLGQNSVITINDESNNDNNDSNANLKKLERIEQKRLKKEERMFKKKNKINSGINTTLAGYDLQKEAEANLDFLKNMNASKNMSDNSNDAENKANNLENTSEAKADDLSKNSEHKNEIVSENNSNNASDSNVDKAVETNKNINSNAGPALSFLNNNSVPAHINEPNKELADQMARIQNARKYGRRMDYKTATSKANVEVKPETEETKVNVEVKPEAEETKVNVEVKPEAEETKVNVEVKPEAEETKANVEVKQETEDAKVNIEVKQEAIKSTNTDDKLPELISKNDNNKAEEKAETKKTINYIKNPLPVPKKHVPKELDFDVIPGEADMHFDIVDLKGKDFFDIN